jgi:hypothetical protein
MSGLEQPKHHYAIKRLRAGTGTWYWFVKFSRRGSFYERRFYDPKHGGTEAALQAAVRWRDAMMAKVRVLRMSEFCQQRRSNNTSGVPGVHFLRPPSQPEGIWQAKLKLGGGRSDTKSFSVLKHGERRAFELAVEARQRMLAQAEDRAYVYDPLAKAVAARQQGGAA